MRFAWLHVSVLLQGHIYHHFYIRLYSRQTQQASSDNFCV